MRKQVLVIALSIITLAINATIWRVTKDASFLPHFGNLQHAIDSCGVGDTIYVYPGNYSSIEIKKQLAIFGVGYFIAENAKDSLTSFASTSNVDNVTFSTGSDFSLISGISVGGITCNNVNNITISGNKYGGISLNNTKYLTIKKNIGGSITGIRCSNALISNNIWSGGGQTNGVNFDEYSNVILQNNYLQCRIVIYNSIVFNNIEDYNPRSYDYNWYYLYSSSLNNCNLMSNISTNGTFGSGSNNFSASFEQLYPNGVSADNYKLPQNSIAKGKGLGGVDCGPFGGDDPYCLSGLNYIPTIAKLSMPIKANGNNGLPVKVIVKSNKP